MAPSNLQSQHAGTKSKQGDVGIRLADLVWPYMSEYSRDGFLFLPSYLYLGGGMYFFFRFFP